MVDDLAQAPWQVSVGLGVAAFVAIRWILPASMANNLIFGPLTVALSGFAWLFGGFFFVIGAIVYFKQRKAAPMPVAIPEAGLAQTGGTLPRGRPVELPNQQEPLRREPLGTGDIRGGIAPIGGLRTERPGVADAAPSTNQPTKASVLPTEWTIQLIRDIEWKRFEDVCQRFYQLKGIRSETTALGADGGIDIRLYQDDSGRPTSIVQCKAWGEKFVGVKPVRELLGVMTHEQVPKGFFMASSRFSEEAKVIASTNRITLIDGEMLLMMIKRLPPLQQNQLLAFATAGDYKTPTCPSCGIRMRGVLGKGGRSAFWGCPRFPGCRQKLGMRRVDAARLIPVPA